MALTGPSFQIGVDVPSLTQLMIKLGTAGLKQMANSGVDIHTLACMLKVAELVPACHQFRQDLSSARKKQREKQFWLYAVVEMGTATNFPVDLLLRTRAGENVMSLFCALLPMLPKSLCVKVLERLFDLCKSVPDETPSISQMRNLCETLNSLALDLDIKNKVIKYAAFFDTIVLQSGSRQPEIEDLIVKSLPDPTSLAQAIVSLHNITTHRGDSVLIWPGVQGAAWLAVYAACVLGLPTCALGPDGEVPINSAYISACVILDLKDNTGAVRTFRRASASNIEELFYLPLKSNSFKRFDLYGAGAEWDSLRRWLFDCSAVNYLTLHFSAKPETSLYHFLSDIITATALHTLVRLIHIICRQPFVQKNVLAMPSTFSPAESFYANMSTRLLRVLELLGFRVLTSGSDPNIIYSKFKVLDDGDDSRFWTKSFRREDRYYCYFTEYWTSKLRALNIECSLPPSAFPNLCIKTVALAITLAVTDWDESWQRLPLSVIKQTDAKPFLTEFSSAAGDRGQDCWYSQLDSLLFKTLGLEPDRAWRVNSAKTVAFRLLGVMLLRTCVDYKDRLWTNSVLYRLIPGTTRSQDTSFRYIASEYALNQSLLHHPLNVETILQLDIGMESTESESDQQTLKERKALVRPELQAITFADGEMVFLRLQCFIEAQYKGSINCLNIFDKLPERYISLPCEHDLSELCQFPFFCENAYKAKVQWRCDETIAFYVETDDNLGSFRVEAWFSPSEDYLETQWALCAALGDAVLSGFDRVAYRIGTCTRCLLSQIAERFDIRLHADPPLKTDARNIFRILIVPSDNNMIVNARGVDAAEVE